MMYDTQRDNTFFYLTFCYGILYVDDLKTFLADAKEIGIDIISPNFLEMMVDILTTYSKEGKFTPHLIYNIYDFVNYCRFDEKVLSNPPLKAETFSYCNQLIHLANQQSYSQQPPIYYEEIARRFKGKIEVILKTFSYWTYPQEFMDAINYMRELDFRILCIHSELVTEEEFELEIVSMLADPHYLICIEYLLNTYPELFKDKHFSKRVLKTLESNNNLIMEAKGKSIESSIYEIDDEDDVLVLNNSSFIKTNKKLKRRIRKLKKDS